MHQRCLLFGQELLVAFSSVEYEYGAPLHYDRISVSTGNTPLLETCIDGTRLA